MRSFLSALAASLVLSSSCVAAGSGERAGEPTRAGAGSPETDSGERGGPLDRAHLYEVAPEQVRPGAAADSVSVLEVSGSAEVRVPADRARITFAVETEDSTAGGAAAENARRMEAAIAALRDAGVEGLEIETRGYALQPRYRRPDGPGSREIDGYRARNLVVVTVPEVDAVGRLIDTAVGGGANRVTSLAFEAADTEPARLEALRRAVERARREAEAVAGALGVELGPALEVRTEARSARPQVRFRAEAAFQAPAPDTPVEPGEQTVEATVTIRYRLGTP